MMFYSVDSYGNTEAPTKTQTLTINTDADGDGYSLACDCNDTPVSNTQVKVKVDISKFQNRYAGNTSNKVYLANGTVVENGQWIPLTNADGSFINDTATTHNVPGLYLQRSNGQILISSYGFRKNSECAKESDDGYKDKDSAVCQQKGKEALS
jgi:hypothetical protein